MPDLEPGQEDVLAVEPERVRRHRDADVVAEHRRHRGDIGPLVRLDRSPEQLELGLGRDRRRTALAAVRAVGRHRRPGTLQGAVGRDDRHLEQRGGLLRRPVEDVAQDQDRALARRQQLDRGKERQLDGLARHGHGVGLVLARRDLVEQVVGVGLQPRDLAQRLERARGEPPVGTPDGVEADVRRDLVQPRPERRGAVEGLAGCATPGDRSPGRRPRPPRTSRASGTSARAARAGGARRGRRRRCRRRSRSSASDRTIGAGRAVHAHTTSRGDPDSSMSSRPCRRSMG